MSIAEIISRVRESLKSLSSTEIKKLSREKFVEVLGIDPKQIPLEDRMEIAKTLYNEFRHVISYRWLSDKLSMSLRDVQKAIKGEEEGEKEPLPKLSPDVVAEAIKLFREGRIRNPNDLVLELRIGLDEAEQLFKRIAENEKAVSITVIEATQKLDRILKDISKRSEKIEELVKTIKSINIENLKKEIDSVLKEIENAIEKHREELKKSYLNMINELEERVQSFSKEVEKLYTTINSIHLHLEALGMYIETFLDLIKKIKDLDEKAKSLEKNMIELSKRVERIEAHLKIKHQIKHPAQPHNLRNT
uniref:Uncharacterized protein n=1 Tax=Ignisphaera aggregans TaxID=334771 RepID=A0A7C4FBK3_9CREN